MKRNARTLRAEEQKQDKTHTHTNTQKFIDSAGLETHFAPKALKIVNAALFCMQTIFFHTNNRYIQWNRQFQVKWFEDLSDFSLIHTNLCRLAFEWIHRLMALFIGICFIFVVAVIEHFSVLLLYYNI